MRYGGDQALVRIADLRIIEGKLPRRAERMLLEWAEEQRAELMENWELCKTSKPPRTIVPLVNPPVICNHPKDVASVQALPGYRLHVRFHDGLEAKVDLSRRVRATNAGVFAPLAYPDRFAQVGIEFGAVWWPGDIDLAPDAIHAELKPMGVGCLIDQLRSNL